MLVYPDSSWLIMSVISKLCGPAWNRAAVHADAAVSIDADLQDDVEAIPLMVDCFNKGIDIVFGVGRTET